MLQSFASCRPEVGFMLELVSELFAHGSSMPSVIINGINQLDDKSLLSQSRRLEETSRA
jgi:hypothetical protein